MPPRGAASIHAATLSNWRIIVLLGCGYIIMVLLVTLLPSRSAKIESTSPTVAAGAEVWRSANCTACHSIYGLGGHIGSDLTNAISRLGKDGVTGMIYAGGPRMPRFEFSQEETANLVAWLSYIDETGGYPLPRHFTPGYGDIE